MNEGYLFLILSWILCLLTYTHWLDFLWQGGTYRLPRQRQRLLFVVFMMMILQAFSIPIHSQVSLNGAACVLSVLFFYHFWKDQSGYRLQLLAVVLFLAVFYAVSYEVFRLDPILMFISPVLMLPLFMTIFIALTTTNLYLQWLMMTGGLLLGEVLHKIFMLKHVNQIYIGDAAFRDQFIITLILITGVHYVVRFCYKSLQAILRHLRIRYSDGKQEG